MQVKNKLMILELISGLFGWGWIVASIATLYFFVMAIGFEGEWSPFFWAFGAGAIAKWLAGGFEENKLRIARESQSSSIMTNENQKKADRRAEVISDFGQFLELNPTGIEITDISKLPHNKEEILDAICMQMIVTDDESLFSALEVAAITLADFQEGVGSEPLNSLGVSAEQLLQSSESNEDALALARKITDNPNEAKYETFRAIADEDLTNIQAKIMAAKQIREQMSQEKKSEILG